MMQIDIYDTHDTYITVWENLCQFRYLCISLSFAYKYIYMYR